MSCIKNADRKSAWKKIQKNRPLKILTKPVLTDDNRSLNCKRITKCHMEKKWEKWAKVVVFFLGRCVELRKITSKRMEFVVQNSGLFKGKSGNGNVLINVISSHSNRTRIVIRISESNIFDHGFFLWSKVKVMGFYPCVGGLKIRMSNALKKKKCNVLKLLGQFRLRSKPT